MGPLSAPVFLLLLVTAGEVAVVVAAAVVVLVSPACWMVSVWACPSGCWWVGRKAGRSVWLWRSALGSRFQWV